MDSTHPRPTRKQHIEQCGTISIALTQFVKDEYERLKWAVDQWEPEPHPAMQSPNDT